MTTNITTPATTETTEATTTTAPVAPETKTRVLGSLQTGVDTSGVKFKSVLELRSEFGENWM